MATTRRPERIALRVEKGRLVPADGLSESRLRAKGFHIGDVVFAELKKPRNPGFHRLAHSLGQIVADNIDDFSGMDSHSVLKRLQIESGTACDEIAYRVNGMMIIQRIPRSLSFESLDEADFQAVFRGLCRHIASTYWKGLTNEEIERMAELMPQEAI